jgi:glycosyltransferase involved in cell wall biosynthesis
LGNFVCLKILYVTPYYKPSWFYGGPPKCIAEQAEYLAERYAYDLHVITLNKNGADRLFDSDLPVVQHVNGVTVHYLPSSNNVFGRKYFQSPVLKKYLLGFDDVDLVHIHMLFNAFSIAGMQMALKFDIPYIVSLHGMLDAYSLTRSKWMKRIHRFFFENQYLHRARAVHFTTENEFKNAVIHTPIRPVVIPIGFYFHGQLDLNLFIKPNDGKLKLVFLGRINRKKGIDLLISGIGLLPIEIRKNVCLDVWGLEDEPCKPELDKQILKLGLGDQIIFKGNLAPDERDATLKQYDVLVLTSHQENFGMVVVEALEQKIPVLISDRVNLSDFVKMKNCGIVTELNPNSIAKHLSALYQLSPESRAEMGVNGYHAVRKLFNMKVIGQLYHELYELCSNK